MGYVGTEGFKSSPDDSNGKHSLKTTALAYLSNRIFIHLDSQLLNKIVISSKL